MTIEDLYEEYEDEYSGDSFQKFVKKPKGAVPGKITEKQARRDEISNKRREKQAERDQLMADQEDEHFIVL